MPQSSSRRLTLQPNPTLASLPVSLEPRREQPSLLEAVYRVEAPRLARYFGRRVREPDDAHDLIHEAFTRLAGKTGLRASTSPDVFLDPKRSGCIRADLDRGKPLAELGRRPSAPHSPPRLLFADHGQIIALFMDMQLVTLGQHPLARRRVGHPVAQPRFPEKCPQ